MDLLNLILTNTWAAILVVLFFGGSIFVHELGHFLAARSRGVHVERFSIGMGPKLFSWRGKDGVEYRISWLPIGGYVALPQLADMAGVEGQSSKDLSQLPPPTYGTRMLVFAAGACCNLVFAFLLACILWGVGMEVSSHQSTTTIGYVTESIKLADDTPVPSPAAAAGLRAGDRVIAIDGQAVRDWNEIQQAIVIGAEHTLDGKRKAVFSIERDGQPREVTVLPLLSGPEEIRTVGIGPAYDLLVDAVEPGTPASAAGLQVGDRLLRIDGISVRNFQTYLEVLRQDKTQVAPLEVRRGPQVVLLNLPARSDLEEPADIGLGLTTEASIVHTNPIQQFGEHIQNTFNTLLSLINPKSDIGLSKLSGPIGIINAFHTFARVDIRLVLWLTVLVNINLAIFNLLPIPVLDGGHMAFATIGKLLGRPLPPQLILSAQSVFMFLLFSMIIYVSFFDVGRTFR